MAVPAKQVYAPSGGTPPYNYDWNSGQSDSLITGLGCREPISSRSRMRMAALGWIPSMIDANQRVSKTK